MYSPQELRGGTLGLFLEGEVDGKHKFIKTHHQGNHYHNNLKKEIMIMKYLYEGKLDIENYEIQNGRLCMVMDYLDNSLIIETPKQIAHEIKEYTQQLKGSELPLLCINCSMDDILEASKYSLEFLCKKGMMHKENVNCCENSLKRLEAYVTESEPVICHGDLSTVNIMRMGEQEYIIDWEDAIIGIPDYDLLYWLTFYKQRQYYSNNLLADLSIPLEYGKDIMSAILLVKGYLSVSNGNYLTNKMSVEDRIIEIIRM